MLSDGVGDKFNLSWRVQVLACVWIHRWLDNRRTPLTSYKFLSYGLLLFCFAFSCLFLPPVLAPLPATVTDI